MQNSGSLLIKKIKHLIIDKSFKGQSPSCVHFLVPISRLVLAPAPAPLIALSDGRSQGGAEGEMLSPLDLFIFKLNFCLYNRLLVIATI